MPGFLKVTGFDMGTRDYRTLHISDFGTTKWAIIFNHISIFKIALRIFLNTSITKVVNAFFFSLHFPFKCSLRYFNLLTTWTQTRRPTLSTLWLLMEKKMVSILKTSWKVCYRSENKEYAAKRNIKPLVKWKSELAWKTWWLDLKDCVRKRPFSLPPFQRPEGCEVENIFLPQKGLSWFVMANYRVW